MNQTKQPRGDWVMNRAAALWRALLSPKVWLALYLLLSISHPGGALPSSCFAVGYKRVGNSELLLQRLNQYRGSYGLPPLQRSASADRAANLQATYNLVHHAHGHFNPSYPTPGARLAAVGHKYAKTEELLRYNRENCVRMRGLTAEEIANLDICILNAYKGSSSHNAALLDKYPTTVGIASVYDGWEMQNTLLFCI